MSGNYVLKLSNNEIEKIKQTYAKQRLDKKIPYVDFVAKIENTTITVYTSGKVMFQGRDAEIFARKWGADISDIKTKNSIQGNHSSLPENLSQLSIIGSDEVGNGSYFGPVTVCATFVDKKMLTTLSQLGVKDSKELNDHTIIQLSKVIKKQIPYKLLILNPEKYNQIQPKYNAVHMKVALHNQAIYLLLKKIAPVKPEAILIDQFTPKPNYMKYVKNEENQINEALYFKTKGEKYHLAVAAASIISRATFLEELEKASKKLEIQLPSGAGEKSDQVAARLLEIGGLDLLAQYAKLHFANTKKAEIIARKRN